MCKILFDHVQELVIVAEVNNLEESFENFHHVVLHVALVDDVVVQRGMY